MTWTRTAIIAALVGEPAGSRRYNEALREANITMLGESIMECIKRPSGLLVNRQRIEALVDHLVFTVTNPPAIELMPGGNPIQPTRPKPVKK